MDLISEDSAFQAGLQTKQCVAFNIFVNNLKENIKQQHGKRR